LSSEADRWRIRASIVDLRDYCISSVFLIFGHEHTPPASPAFLFE